MTASGRLQPFANPEILSFECPLSVKADIPPGINKQGNRAADLINRTAPLFRDTQ
jgi:hypothetical protein